MKVMVNEEPFDIDITSSYVKEYCGTKIKFFNGIDKATGRECSGCMLLEKPTEQLINICKQ